MSDESVNQDRQRIAPFPSAIRYLAHKIGLPPSIVKMAIEQEGPYREDVEHFLLSLKNECY